MVHLDLSNNSIAHLCDSLSMFRHKYLIINFIMQRNSIQTRHKDCFRGMKNLLNLNISLNIIVGLGPSAFAGAEKLI